MRIVLIIVFVSAAVFCRSQGCCSGGSGSPIAGGAMQGVLQERQMEVAVNHQYLSTDRFLVGDKDTASLFDKMNSNYLYMRLAYGVTRKLTMSVESGYFFNKTQYGLERTDTIRSSGVADLILFPRYCLYTRNTEKTRTEITVGMGFKIPLGKYNDSTVVYRNPKTNKRYYTISPPTIQPTNGSRDLIFYGFLFRGYTETRFKTFANLIYIHKGWNPLGQKFGDYASAGLFASQEVWKGISATLQVRGEFVAKMQHDPDQDMMALYNIDVQSTGGRKVFVAPQLSYANSGFIFFILYETPVYQYLNGTQVGSQHQITGGISYRFFTRSAEE